MNMGATDEEQNIFSNIPIVYIPVHSSDAHRETKNPVKSEPKDIR